MTRTRHNMHHPTPDPYPDEPVGDRTDDEVYRNDDARFAGDDRPDHDDEDSVTDDLATARRWFNQDGAVVVNEEDGVSYLHTFGSLPIYGVESYQRNGGS